METDVPYGKTASPAHVQDETGNEAGSCIAVENISSYPSPSYTRDDELVRLSAAEQETTPERTFSSLFPPVPFPADAVKTARIRRT